MEVWISPWHSEWERVGEERSYKLKLKSNLFAFPTPSAVCAFPFP